MELSEATVLIVDDELELQAIIARWFERGGARVLTAGNGAAALTVLAEHHVDLMISDIRMPVMDGVALARRLAAYDNYIPKMIFVSGFSDADNRELYDLGIEAMLRKPMMRKDLLDAARRCLADKQARWRDPLPAMPTATLSAGFESLPAALDDHLIAFGRGGFCLRSSRTVRDDEPVSISIAFAAERQGLSGQGIIRWTDGNRCEVGIEIICVDETDRPWIVGLTTRDDIRCFIPRTTDLRGNPGR